MIPNSNGSSLLKKVLDDLSRQQLKPEEVIVVDNGSTDDSVRVAAAKGAVVIPLAANTGFCKAVNCGIRAVKGDWLCVLNNDVELEPDYLVRLCAAAEAGRFWFATGKIRSRQRPDFIDGTYDAVCRGACAWRCGQGRPDSPIWNERTTIQFVPLTAALLRKELFAQVGFLDESFEAYLEDVELGFRCAIAGYHGIYVPEAVAYHHGSATWGRWNKKTVRLMARNQVLLVAKHYPKGWVRRAGWAVLVAQLLWGCVALRHGAGMAYVLGKIDGLRRFRRERAAGSEEVWSVLNSSEANIFNLQRKTGFDSFWRLYFWLV